MDARTPKAMKDAASAAKGRASRLGLIEFIRKVREDQLLIVTPELFGEELVYSRILFLHSFLINKPEYIEHVLLANHANYRKSHFSRNLLGPLLGNGLLTSEGELWRRQRRIAAPAFHARRTAEFVATMGSCSEAMLTRWAARSGSFDGAAEMTALTLDIIARTMFSTEVAGEIDAIRQLTDVVVKLRPSLLDLFGFPQWIPRLQPKPYRAAVAAFEALVARFLAERRGSKVERGDLFDAACGARRRDRPRHERAAAARRDFDHLPRRPRDHRQCTELDLVSPGAEPAGGGAAARGARPRARRPHAAFHRPRRAQMDPHGDRGGDAALSAGAHHCPRRHRRGSHRW